MYDMLDPCPNQPCLATADQVLPTTPSMSTTSALPTSPSVSSKALAALMSHPISIVHRPASPCHANHCSLSMPLNAISVQSRCPWRMTNALTLNACAVPPADDEPRRMTNALTLLGRGEQFEHSRCMQLNARVVSRSDELSLSRRVVAI